MSDMLDAVKGYTARGWVVHPLSRPDDKGLSPGKKPLLTGWQKLTKTPDDIGSYIKKGCNIGLVCGKASGVTVIDFDSMAFMDDVFGGINFYELDTLVSRRVDGRCHVYFKYNPELKSQKHHLLGIEILNDGSNAVLPPSVHESGTQYHWTNINKMLIEVRAVP